MGRGITDAEDPMKNQLEVFRKSAEAWLNEVLAGKIVITATRTYKTTHPEVEDFDDDD